MIYICENCTEAFVSDNTPETCPACKNTDIRRATDTEVMDYIGSIFVAPFEKREEKGGRSTE